MKNMKKSAKKIAKAVNKACKKHPVGVVIGTGAIATTSTVGAVTIITDLIRLPGAIKRRFSKMNLGNNGNTDNTNNNTDNNDIEDIIEDDNN